MSQQDQQTSITSQADPEQLKQQAEAQQRRRAPPLSNQQPQKKKPKLDSGEEQDDGDKEEEQEGAVGRFAYAAADAIIAGSTCLMASCGFNRQRSAAKELLSIVKPLLPEGTQLQMVKVGCRGLAVVRLEPRVPVIPLVGQVLDQIQSGQLKPTRFCERIVPAEMTCLLTSVALEAALTKAARAYLAGRQQQQQQQQQQQGTADGAAEPAADAVPAQQQPVEFAVMYKSRGVDKQILADMEKEALQQQQEQEAEKQQQEQDKQQQEQEQEQEQEQDKPQQQQQAAADGAGPAAEEVQGLNRQRIIDLAVAVMQECCKECGGAKVNLRKPQVVVMVEVVPLLRQQTACAVAMLPASIMSDSIKLKVKLSSLESEQHVQKQKQQGGGGGSKKK